MKAFKQRDHKLILSIVVVLIVCTEVLACFFLNEWRVIEQYHDINEFFVALLELALH